MSLDDYHLIDEHFDDGEEIIIDMILAEREKEED